ncbi:hypothetical protein MTO96_043894, partial [Rhipicephalus appendiculatus]
VLVFEDAPNAVSLPPSPLECKSSWFRTLGWTKKTSGGATMWVDSLTNFKPELFGLPPFEETGKKSSPGGARNGL